VGQGAARGVPRGGVPPAGARRLELELVEVG
jgi:hypothetical protein